MFVINVVQQNLRFKRLSLILRPDEVDRQIADGFAAGMPRVPQHGKVNAFDGQGKYSGFMALPTGKSYRVLTYTVSLANVTSHVSTAPQNLIIFFAPHSLSTN